jgi:PAS domain-containing protein
MAERILAEKKVRASERRYRRLISNLDTGVVVHGSDTRILLANHRAQDRFHPVSVEFQTLRTHWW